MNTCNVNTSANPTVGLRHEICVDLINRFHKKLNKLSDFYQNHPCVKVEVINSAGTLEETDWANELHPTSQGFNKIADQCWKNPIRNAV
jgi:hypothetical protein